MNGDGSGIRQITFLPGTYFEPSVMKDGRVLFSFWDPFHIDVPPFDKHETYLMTVNPDGTDERHLFGAGQYRFFNRERHSGIGLTQAREMPDGRILVQSEMGPSLLDPRAGTSVSDALTPIFPGTTSVQLGGTTHRVHLSPLGTRSTAYPLQDGRIIYSATAPGARDSAIYVADPATREEKLIFNIPNYCEFDAVPVLVNRPKPALVPPQSANAPSKEPSTKLEEPMAKFLVVAGRVCDNPERGEAMKRARFFRVVEAEYTAVTTSSHTNLETRILGVVPIFPDGSAYFEAPADTPLFLDPLDAGGNRVLMKWNYENTSVAVGTHYPATQMAYMSARPGETRSCYGCHAPQSEAVPNVKPQALKFPPVRVTRESTDVQYRRNETLGYRRQARFDEAAKFHAWLGDKDPVRRARACEALMYIEDGIDKSVPLIAKLLGDDAVSVQRAAALALSRLATPKEKEALAAASGDGDWQVRFCATAALDAVGDNREHVRQALSQPLPDVAAIRAAGKLKDADAVKLLIPWLKKHEHEYHALEAALALGRIGTKEAIAALWEAARSEIPNKKVHIARYLQHGPRPEEYALLKALIIANAPVDLRDVYLLLAMLPNTFMEKPRFEDRMRGETERGLMPRMLLERAGLRRRAADVLIAALAGEQKTGDPLYEQIIKGINLERPFSE